MVGMEARDAVGSILLMLEWFARTKVGRWLIGLSAAILMALALAYAAFRKGKRVQADADQAKDAQVSAQAAQEVVNAAVVRQEVQRETDALPEAKPQRVLDADRATGAGHLRDDGWMRAPSTPAANPGKAGSAD